MTNETAQLIEEYKTEYHRVNGRIPLVTENHGWITLDNHAVSTFRVNEMRAALVVLKSRANFYPIHPYVTNTIATMGSWK